MKGEYERASRSIDKIGSDLADLEDDLKIERGQGWYIAQGVNEVCRGTCIESWIVLNLE